MKIRVSVVRIRPQAPFFPSITSHLRERTLRCDVGGDLRVSRRSPQHGVPRVATSGVLRRSMTPTAACSLPKVRANPCLCAVHNYASSGNKISLMRKLLPLDALSRGCQRTRAARLTRRYDCDPPMGGQRQPALPQRRAQLELGVRVSGRAQRQRLRRPDQHDWPGRWGCFN